MRGQRLPCLGEAASAGHDFRDRAPFAAVGLAGAAAGKREFDPEKIAQVKLPENEPLT